MVVLLTFQLGHVKVKAEAAAKSRLLANPKSWNFRFSLLSLVLLRLVLGLLIVKVIAIATLVLLILLYPPEVESWHLNWTFILRTWSVRRLLEHEHASLLRTTWSTSSGYPSLSDCLLIGHEHVAINGLLATRAHLACIGAVFPVISDLSPSRMAACVRNIVFIDVQIFHINIIIVVIEYHLAIFGQGSIVWYLRYSLQHWHSRVSRVAIKLVVARNAR